MEEVGEELCWATLFWVADRNLLIILTFLPFLIITGAGGVVFVWLLPAE